VSFDEVASRLTTEIPEATAREVSLERFTTYRLGGPASLLVEVETDEQLDAVARALAGTAVEVLVVGRGSNLVVSDHGWPGVAIHLGKGFTGIVEIDGGIRAGGAASLPVVANWCARRGLAGFEFAIAIPGSIGGAVRMNAGAHGRAMADALTGATVVDLRDGTRARRAASSLDLGYRHSNLDAAEVVVDAELHLATRSPDEVKRLIDTYRRHRAETQPGAAQNAGSVFQNPPGDHAGRLVDATGLKGFRVGGVEVSTLHANFFIADRGARAQDVYDLVHEVRARVLARFGVELSPEIRFVGRFEDRVGQARR